MKVYIGADHNGFFLRNSLIKYLQQAGYDVDDEGGKKLDPVDDFPVFSQRVVKSVLASEDEEARGIIICGSGQGACMAANRFRGIRACLGYNQNAARAARNDEDSNVLCLPARTLSKDEANLIVETFLNVPFAAAPRYIRRIKELDEL